MKELQPDPRKGALSRASGAVRRAEIVGFSPEGAILVRPERGRRHLVRCERLQGEGTKRLRYREGDRVLVLMPTRSGEPGCVLGKVGWMEPEERVEEGEPEQTVLEAVGRLTLVCGQASITLDESGKILIEGVDILSRARTSNRIKGGSVRIN